MGILSWILFGLIAGFIAKLIDGDSFSLLGTIILGIAGAAFGGWVGSLLGLGSTGDFSLGSFVTAVVGALLLLFIYRAVAGRR